MKMKPQCPYRVMKSRFHLEDYLSCLACNDLKKKTQKHWCENTTCHTATRAPGCAWQHLAAGVLCQAAPKATCPWVPAALCQQGTCHVSPSWSLGWPVLPCRAGGICRQVGHGPGADIDVVFPLWSPVWWMEKGTTQHHSTPWDAPAHCWPSTAPWELLVEDTIGLQNPIVLEPLNGRVGRALSAHPVPICCHGGIERAAQGPIQPGHLQGWGTISLFQCFPALSVENFPLPFAPNLSHCPSEMPSRLWTHSSQLHSPGAKAASGANTAPADVNYVLLL